MCLGESFQNLHIPGGLASPRTFSTTFQNLLSSSVLYPETFVQDFTLQTSSLAPPFPHLGWGYLQTARPPQPTLFFSQNGHQPSKARRNFADSIGSGPKVCFLASEISETKKSLKDPLRGLAP